MDVLGSCLGANHSHYHCGGNHYCSQDMTTAAISVFQVSNQTLYCLLTFISFCQDEADMILIWSA